MVFDLGMFVGGEVCPEPCQRVSKQAEAPPFIRTKRFSIMSGSFMLLSIVKCFFQKGFMRTFFKKKQL